MFRTEDFIGFEVRNMYVPETVYNQKYANTSLAIAAADMVTTMYRMRHPNIQLTLSPQPLADVGCCTYAQLDILLTDQRYGLQSINDFPFINMRNVSHEPRYQSGPKYTIKSLKSYVQPDAIKHQILKNFYRGHRYPLIGMLKMCNFTRERAKTAFNGSPYRHPIDAESVRLVSEEQVHALLIVGLDTFSLNPMDHGCIVKNSYGVKWGEGGYSKVAFETFIEVMVPGFE